MTPVAFSALPGWSADSVAAALPAFLRSCPSLARRAPDSPMSKALPEAGMMRDWQAACAEAAGLPAGDETAARAFFERRFQPYRASNNRDPKGLFTGYYEIELRGSLTRTQHYDVPIYGIPKDLVTADLSEFGIPRKVIVGRVVKGKFHPYPDRAAIDGGALVAEAPVLAWVDSAVDAFFLHIQGSGLIRLADGSTLRVGYAAKNGQPYRAIGRVLVERGALAKTDVSMQSIRAWLEANPKAGRAVMAANPSYVFFRKIKPRAPEDGPDGAMAVALTAGRSLAVDRRFVPLGIPIWVAAQNPDRADDRTQRLLVSQDTGGAITGPVRGDVFWGTGAAAAARAGIMREFGNYFLLLPRAPSTPVASAE